MSKRKDGDGSREEADRPMIDLEFVRGLIRAVDGSNIDSLEISRGGTSIRLAKTPPTAAAAPASPAAPVATPQPAPTAPAAGAGTAAAGIMESAASAEGAETGAAADGLIEVTSPMVGTFYRAPSPDAPPYVEVGTRVSEGQTLCILEAMKLMNELESEVGGVIREILVENAEPVEYGQVLFRVEPA